MQRGRITEELSEHYKQLSLPKLQNSFRRVFREMMYVNKAHTIMLYSKGIIELDVAQKLLRATNEVQKEYQLQDLSLDKGDDLYMNVEAQIIARVGEDVGGRIHTGRSRNDLYSTLTRMTVRRYLWTVMDQVIALQEIMCEIARKNLDTFFTGYTHMQPAQPSTVAHYFSSCINNLSRDFRRLAEAYANTNQSALGAAAFAGTGFPIDREQTGELLGFDMVLENTWDCVASRDYLLQAESAYTILQNTISRIAQDLFIWSTDEFGVWELGGQVSGQSSIMPQKKNPSALEEVKATCGSGLAAFSSSFAALKNSAFTFVCDTFRLDVDFDHAQQDMVQALEVMKEALRYSSIKKERALSMAEENFCTVTGLADLLVCRFNISFRSAHHITGGMVGDIKRKGLSVSDMDSALLREWSKKILGYPLELEDEQLRTALSVIGNVDSKDCLGGPRQSRVADMLGHAEDTIQVEKKWLESVISKVDAAYGRIESEMKRILEPRSGEE